MSEWHFPAWLTGSAVVVAGISLFALVIRQIGPWRKQISEMEERLRTELLVRHKECENELRLVRHRVKGSRQLIYSLLHLFDMPPESRTRALDNIRAELAAMELAEATETGIVMAGPVGDGFKP